MKRPMAAHVYITKETFYSLSEQSKYDDIIALSEQVKRKIDEYSNSKNIVIECAKDFLEYKNNQEDKSLEEKILDIAQEDLSFFQYYYDTIEKAISHVKTDVYSEHYNNILSTPLTKSTLPRHYSLTVGGSDENDLLSVLTDGWTNTLRKNAYFVASKNKDKEEFIEWTKIIHGNLEFHKDICGTLDTIIQGDYSDYRKIISEALDALNQSINFLSLNPNNNQDDLNIIAEYTSRTGRRLSCSRQGANKPFFYFPINGRKEEERVNCEYHLKINWDDSGHRLESKRNVRIYFAIKYDELLCRKRIKVAHIGKHY
ncbi:hypothetical protein [Aeromonas tecta]|uniref:hypothetical protein n=1 Tax=Aeromonas tecta TaxID=324617 RepID=UPI0012F9C405|nr:hypothetical protein [Aeromonas tecta]